MKSSYQRRISETISPLNYNFTSNPQLAHLGSNHTGEEVSLLDPTHDGRATETRGNSTQNKLMKGDYHQELSEQSQLQ